MLSKNHSSVQWPKRIFFLAFLTSKSDWRLLLTKFGDWDNLKRSFKASMEILVLVSKLKSILTSQTVNSSENPAFTKISCLPLCLTSNLLLASPPLKSSDSNRWLNNRWSSVTLTFARHWLVMLYCQGVTLCTGILIDNWPTHSLSLCILISPSIPSPIWMLGMALRLSLALLAFHGWVLKITKRMEAKGFWFD